MWIKKKKTHIFGVIFIGKNIFFYQKNVSRNLFSKESSQVFL